MGGHYSSNNYASIPSSLQSVNGISQQSLDNKLRILKQERQNLAKRHAKFYDVRQRFKTELEDRVKRGGKKGPGKSPAASTGGATSASTSRNQGGIARKRQASGMSLCDWHYFGFGISNRTIGLREAARKHPVNHPLLLLAAPLLLLLQRLRVVSLGNDRHQV